ncbi:golgin subfamily A member 6C-like isoform X2 [Pongo pygmaeus]|uniref:golgin subfamily A member 6C-like isoform X2 n=1 Tax=Pongo pygmaeus TaxID=9600 RepID=UPI0023E2B46F|nr:golgin subfamily A member 6C-like isoform X2 [Pongo pygmaeus]
MQFENTASDSTFLLYVVLVTTPLAQSHSSLAGDWRCSLMWPQPYGPPHPMMLEETRQNKLAAAKKKLKEYQQRSSPGVARGAKIKKKKTGSSPETTTSGGCHSPGDSSSNSSSLHVPQSQYQGLAVALESSSMTIHQLNENIESLKEQKKEVEHQLEEAKKANNEIHKAQTEQLETINILTLEKADLKTTLYHTKRAAQHFEEESKDLAGRLQYSLQRIQELERALCAVSTQQQEEDRSSSCSEAVLKRRLQQTIKERALLNTHVTQVTESLKQVQLQKDEYAEHIKGERARWQERMRKMSVEARTLKEEKKSDIHRIQELERSLSELQNQMAEPPSLAPPAVTSLVEQLQDEAKHLRQEVEGLEGKLQSQVENNQALSLLSKEQKQRLQEQEEMLREQKEWRVWEQKRLCEQNETLQEQQKTLGEQGERLRKQEQRLRKQEERLRKEEERLRKQEKRLWDQEERLWKKEERLQKQEERLQKQEERLRKQERLMLSQNHKLDKQLAEPQCSFKDLNNENKSALQLQQHVKELQEKLDNVKKMVTSTPSKKGWEEHLEAASQQNQQLETQLSLMALPGEGDGARHLDSEEEEVPQPMPNIPEDLESREATVSLTSPAPLCHLPLWSLPDPLMLLVFPPSDCSGPSPLPGASGQTPCHLWPTGALSEAPREGAVLHLPAPFVLCMPLQEYSPLAFKWHFSTPLEPVPRRSRHGYVGSRSCEGCAAHTWLIWWPRPGRSQRQRPQSQGLGSGFMDLRKEKADRKEQVEKLEIGFIQLSGATDGMREYITVYDSQGAVPNTRHQEMEDVISLAQNEEETKELMWPLGDDYNEGHDKFLTTAQNPPDEPTPGAPGPKELGAAGEHDDFYEVNLDDSVEPAPAATREGSAQQIVQLPPVRQDTQEHPGLPSKPCVPFFYRAAENREINIIII